MRKKRTQVKMPKWIWQLSPKILPTATKQLLSYIWWFGDKGCPKWNWYLAKREKISPRQLRRRLLKLHQLHLIAIINPHYKRRRLYRLPYFDIKVWYREMARWKDLTGGTQMTYIYDPFGGIKYKTLNSPLKTEAESPVLTGDDPV